MSSQEITHNNKKGDPEKREVKTESPHGNTDIWEVRISDLRSVSTI